MPRPTSITLCTGRVARLFGPQQACPCSPWPLTRCSMSWRLVSRGRASRRNALLSSLRLPWSTPSTTASRCSFSLPSTARTVCASAFRSDSSSKSKTGAPARCRSFTARTTGPTTLTSTSSATSTPNSPRRWCTRCSRTSRPALLLSTRRRRRWSFRTLRHRTRSSPPSTTTGLGLRCLGGTRAACTRSSTSSCRASLCMSSPSSLSSPSSPSRTIWRRLSSALSSSPSRCA
mmetsp:Transcript_61723/g.145434  ORF Transcript_61723/g.145434 Transcript_61723/m.145434 type:complete len:232 (-) Transcript_61723:2431-3126(-)